MRIREIQVENFRKLRRVEITGLQDGANVITGENEAGKSTLLAAVQTGLFQRHNVTGKVLDAMQPYACALRPRIHVAFDLGDQRYTLRKTFGAACSAELIASGGQRWANHDADRRLEEILRFQAPSRGASRFSELGMWPLFWVEQGSTFQDVRLNPDVRTTVHTSLRKEVGDILVGESGGWLKQRIQTFTATYFTPGGRETGALAGARKCADELHSVLKIKQQEIQNIGETVSALEEAEERLSRLESPELRADLQRQHDAAEIQSLMDRKVEADADSRIATLELDTARATIVQRAEIQGRIQRLEDKRAASARAVKDAQDAHNNIQTEHGRVVVIVEALREKLAIAARDRVQSSRAAECAHASHYCDGLRRQIERARDVGERILSLQTELGELQITQSDVDNLQQLEAEHVRAQVSLESGATRVEIDPAESAEVTLGGVPVLRPSSLLLSEVTDIRAQDVRIRITPGGDRLESRRRRANDTFVALRTALADLQVESVASAAGLANRRVIIEGELIAQNKLALAMAPGGFEAALRSLDQAEKRLTALQSELGAQSVVVDAESAQVALERAEGAEKVLQSELLAQDNILISVRDLREERRNQLTAVETEVRVTESELENVRTALALARDNQTDEALNGALALAHQNVERAKSRGAEIDDRLATANPEKASDQLRMSRDALDLLGQQISDEKQKVHRLRGALDALGHKGLAEECADIEATLIFARLRLKATSDEANALRVLAETILAVEKETNERFLQPVVARVQPYLNRVLPGARVRFDESLAIEGLERGTTVEPYDCISVGAREQISVITRIAFADLLADEGLNAPIILDDALAYSDDRRFRDTLSAIASAAKRHQIILLTCHDERYVRLGARIIRLDSGTLSDSLQALSNASTTV